jgi:hypothetical protein
MATDTIIVGGKEYPSPLGLKVENFLAGHGEIDYHFNNQKRTGLVTEVIVHETVTCSSIQTVEVLEPKSPKNPAGRGLGVHFIVDPDGTAYQHGDLATDLLWHASQHNPTSVGIEVVNPADPKFRPSKGPWQQVIDAPWFAAGMGRGYVVPTKEQSEALYLLLAWLTRDAGQYTNTIDVAEMLFPPELQIPVDFRMLNAHKMVMGRVAGAEALSPGIYAHNNFNHGDGSWLCLYAWLRMIKGMGKDQAYTDAIRRATGVHSPIDLTDVDDDPYEPGII